MADTTTNPRAGGQPSWLVPLLVGALVVLLVVILVLVISRDEAAAPTATDPADPTSTVTDSTEAPAETDPPATEPPATTEAPPATEAPTTEAPTTTEAPVDTEPPAATTAPPSGDGTIGPGEAIITTNRGTFEVAEVAACRVTAAPGLNIHSYLYDAGPLDGPLLLEVVTDEGVDPFVVLSELRGEFEAFNGQDNTAGAYWAAEAPTAFEPTTGLVLDPIAGFSEGPATVSFDLSDDVEGCATGFLGIGWPFAEGEQPQILDQFDPDVLGYGFSVLAACDAEGTTLVLSEAGFLTSFELNGELLADIQLNAQTGDPEYLARWEQRPGDVLVEQQGGGGDVTYVVRVSDFEGTESRYLTWTEPPTGVTGGLPIVNC